MKNANPVWWRAWGCLLAVALGVLAGCDESAPAPAAPPKTIADRFDIHVGAKVVHMQLAVTDLEMQRGLMERRDLGSDDGMLFLYREPQQMSFWMRDTPTPLDIGFFDDGGMLEETYAMQPFDERAIHSRSTLLQFALEMNQDWYHHNGVRPGAQLDLKAVAAALKARGFDPNKYGLRGK